MTNVSMTSFAMARRAILVFLGPLVVAGACSSARSSMSRTASATPASGPQTATRVDTTLQIFLLAGQSNMAGRGAIEARDSVVEPRVLRLDPLMEWAPAVDPLHWDKPAIVGVGPGRVFGLALARHDRNARIGLVPAAVGGSPISSWERSAVDAATRTHPYDDAMERLRVAMRGGGRVRAILWHQGESDATPERSVVYAGKLRALIAQFRADLGDPALPFVIGQLGEFAGRPWTADTRRIDSVHRAIAASVPNVAFVSAAGLRDKGDALHFDAAAARELGERYAAAYLAVARR
jgi:hypothetical protein